MAGFRRTVLLEVATELFSRQGYHAVGIDDIGAAAGVTGPAVYRHFQNKDAILRELCNAAMTELLTGARLAAQEGDAEHVLNVLITVHAGFGARHRRLVAVYVREHRALSPIALRSLRRRQRDYEAIWTDALVQLRPDLGAAEVCGVVTAVLSLINAAAHMPAELDDAAVERLLSTAAAAVLLARSPDDVDVDSAAG
ncbi:TetR/AcrR family transcriptional regulator [Pseudonocardia sp. KRD-184]|uniref:TetR/AcrR family transcriptional regulator n=1 Tax=Pseudonocardia oceani TaxID=2792013 RepID=A0ABS6U284_9PSEU|nr:TetR/AcrR family transcriptional regulator [Pseudonocardia oceani]MBW0088857.1 TetR/AcrR family transcriptional regulator [Pseudonocardia oceani]MBW0095109.1 TetR/AcrR family transcriptional regulator [Pseudonocardia oceani]MBW0107213.1 TetR/AcrR family transcriptional regulator [Pseudonocardia oceani]MBW0119691.1 TetR/AcrR family transcriptional regulator [Pseudonocardia oceani]MBW0126354.1 TetR/AcrR family transcriptional regulator [Pseudonocardia oceani]